MLLLLTCAAFGYGDGDTAYVHAGRGGLGLSAHIPSIDLSTTYPIPDLEMATKSMASLGSGGHPLGSSIYQRLHSPGGARFEEAIATLEGMPEAVAFSSGMAAITAVLLAARAFDGKRHIVAVRPLYGGTESLLTSGLLDVEISWATPETIGEHLRDDTALVICESPCNPTCTIVDICAICKRAGDVPVMVDSTFSTPVLQQPAKQGAALVVHSCTKAIGGHGDVLGGVVACDETWAKRIRRVRGLTGSNLHPFGAYQLHRGLQTLPIRIRAAQATTEEIAKRLAAHPAVESVGYPTSASSRLVGHGKQMSGGGTVLAFSMAGGYEAAKKLMASVKLVVPAVSLGTTDTLIQHPAGVTHRSIDQKSKDASGIGPGMLRLSIGLEDVEDVWADLEQAMR
jgi:cystathionine beta-lyase/cystathionine gamma-synthase